MGGRVRARSNRMVAAGPFEPALQPLRLPEDPKGRGRGTQETWQETPAAIPVPDARESSEVGQAPAEGTVVSSTSGRGGSMSESQAVDESTRLFTDATSIDGSHTAWPSGTIPIW